MIKFEHTEVVGWEHAIRGMRNPKNSWDKSDSLFIPSQYCVLDNNDDYELAEMCGGIAPIIGSNDIKLMHTLSSAGTDHRKFMRMITVYVDITAPLYWWKEFDTYKVGTVANSCSTMHKIHENEFTLDDFSREHLSTFGDYFEGEFTIFDTPTWLEITVKQLEWLRKKYVETKEKGYWWSIIQLLPSSYNQKRTVMLNYEVLANIYKSRRTHKLDEWLNFCNWIESLPYAELITGGNSK